jgi:hypothetical protein
VISEVLIDLDINCCYLKNNLLTTIVSGANKLYERLVVYLLQEASFLFQPINSGFTTSLLRTQNNENFISTHFNPV